MTVHGFPPACERVEMAKRLGVPIMLSTDPARVTCPECQELPEGSGA